KPLFLLNCVVGDRPIYETLRAKIPAVLQNIDLVQHYKTSPGDCHQLVLFTTQLAASSTAPSLISKAWEECLRLCAHLGTGIPTGDGESERQQQLALAIADAAV